MSKKRWNWKEKHIRKTLSRRWKCKCDWCMSLDKKRYINQILPKQVIKEGIEDSYLRYDDNTALDHWLYNNFPTWEEKIWYQGYLDKKELDVKIPFGILQQELIWALYQGS